MKFKFALALLAVVPFMSISAPDACAQAAYESQGVTGDMGRTSMRSNIIRRPDAQDTTNQTPAKLLRQAGFGGLTRIVGPRGRNGLPPTRLDSFVKTSGYNFMIYGDEGVTLPPLNEFTPASRIQRGNLSNGLSTTHGSVLAPGWGGDEWVDFEGKSMSGPNGGAINNWAPGFAMFGVNRPDMAGAPAQIGSPGQSPSMPIPQNTTPHNSGGGFGFSFP